MEPSILCERAKLADPLVKMRGESHFPFTHPEYPHPWMTEEKLRAADTPGELPSDPFAPGLAGGLRLWEMAAAPSPWTEFRVMSPQRVPAFRKTNTTWLESTVPSFYKVGTVKDGEKVRRPENPAVVDLVREKWGWRLLEAAHALAHRAEVRQRFKPQGYGLYGSMTTNWVARLAAAIRYDLPIDVSGDPASSSQEAAESNDGFYRYGISLCDSNSFHAPFIRVPCIGRNAPVPDRDVCFLAVGVYIEPHPHGFTSGTGKWMEVNRWSCSPTMVSFAGWELADVVYRQQPSVIVNGWSQPEFVIAAPALMPHDRLGDYIAAAKAARGEAVADNVRYWNAVEWLHSQNVQDLISSSPPLPCRECLRLNMRAEGAPGKPQCSPPKDKPKKGNPQMTREEREWADWDSRIDQVFDMIEKAVVYYESRLFGATEAKRRRMSRKKLANERATIIKRIATLTNKAQAALRGGRPSVAERMMAEAGTLKAGIKNAILTPDEKENNQEEKEAGATGPHPAQADAPVDGQGAQ